MSATIPTSQACDDDKTTPPPITPKDGSKQASKQASRQATYPFNIRIIRVKPRGRTSSPRAGGGKARDARAAGAGVTTAGEVHGVRGLVGVGVVRSWF